jgi:hypothetical protein
MARIAVDPNYNSPTFPRATAAADIFLKEDIQALAAAVSTHVHDGAGKGLVITSASGIPAGSITSAMIADGTIATADIADGSITSAKIVDGTIATADLAANAVTNLIGSYNATPTFSTTGTGAWSSTPVSVTGNFGGGRALVTFAAMFQHTAANAQFYTALYLDAAAAVALLHTEPVANGILVVSYSIYVTPAAGGHSVILYINNSTVGTLQINNASTARMDVVEDKR